MNCYPSSRDIIPIKYYAIYQDNIWIENTTETYFFQTDDKYYGVHDYCVVAVFENEAQSIKICQEIDGGTPDCPVAIDFTVTINEECTEAILQWVNPDDVSWAYQGYIIKYNGEFLYEYPYSFGSNEWIHENNFIKGEHTWELTTKCQWDTFSYTLVKDVQANNCPVGINEPKNNVSIYPNPASYTVTVEGKNIVKVEVYNILGQLIDMQKENVQTIDISDYSTGTYFFKVYDLDNNVITKLIVVVK